MLFGYIPALHEVGGSLCKSLSSLTILFEAIQAISYHDCEREMKYELRSLTGQKQACLNAGCGYGMRRRGKRSTGFCRKLMY